jgi:SAM-dependent methyltransferase
MDSRSAPTRITGPWRSRSDSVYADEPNWVPGSEMRVAGTDAFFSRKRHTLPTMPNQFPKREYKPRPRLTRNEDGSPRPLPPRQLPPREHDDDDNRRPPRRRSQPANYPAASTAWEKQAGWYDNLHGDEGDDFHSRLVLPAVMEQLEASPGQRLLDVCCGQGVLGRVAAKAGIYVTGIDASPSLIEAAIKRAGNRERYQVGDARRLGTAFPTDVFDAAALVLALQDIDTIEPVFSGLFKIIRPGGRLVMVMTHPCFRIPKRTSWGYDEELGVQYRRLEGYMSPISLPIRTHPGQENDSSSTTTFHRPMHTYINSLGQQGFGIVGCAELCSHRRGTIGIRSGAEDRAAKEFPVFMVLTAVRLEKAPKRKRSPVPSAKDR